MNYIYNRSLDFKKTYNTVMEEKDLKTLAIKNSNAPDLIAFIKKHYKTLKNTRKNLA